MKNIFENSRTGWGKVGVFIFTKMEIPERWGFYLNFPPLWGMDIFWNLMH